MLKNRIAYILVLIILALFRIAYTGYVAGMLLVIALILPIFSWLISLPGAFYTRTSLSAPDQVSRGSEATVKLTIRQSRLFSTGAVRGKLYSTDTVTGKTKKTRLKAAYDGFALDTEHCCQYQLQLKRLRMYDFMGLIPLPVKKLPPIQVSVVPFPVEPPDHPDWSDNSMLIARPFSGGGNPYDLREYRVGDTMRSIHWKKSAAMDKTVVRDTLEPVERIASIWIDWPEDPSGRDLALDQLAWCIIYLNQNNAGILLQWLDAGGKRQSIYGGPGEIDTVINQMLAQKAGRSCPASVLRPYEILLSAGNGGGKEA